MYIPVSHTNRRSIKNTIGVGMQSLVGIGLMYCLQCLMVNGVVIGILGRGEGAVCVGSTHTYRMINDKIVISTMVEY